jgi:hypothetical protein
MRWWSFALPLAVILSSGLAVAEWLDGNALAWELLFNRPPMVGMFGATALDLPRETPAAAQARDRRDHELRTKLAWSVRVARVSAAVSLLVAITLVWRRRKGSRRQRVLSIAVGLVAVAVFVLVHVM